jgi:hypothetical protein
MRVTMSQLKRTRPRAQIQLFASGVAAQRSVGVASVLKNLPRLGLAKTITLLNSISRKVREPDFLALVGAYALWNQKEASLHDYSNRRISRIYQAKATAFARTILRTSTEGNVAALRDAFTKISLTASAQYVAIALVRYGDASDVLRLIERIERADYRIPYWFQIEVGRTVGRRMRALGGSVPVELLRIYENGEFWRDPRATSLKNVRSKLPLTNLDNRALYVRVVANALIGAAGKDNLDLLQALSQHEYRLVARAAAVRLAQFGDDAMTMLQSAVTDAIEDQVAQSFGEAVRGAEVERFGLIELW